MASTTYRIENYPGFPEGLTGIELSQKFEEQVRKLNVPIYYGDVVKITSDRKVEIEGKKLSAKALIIASGTETKKLGIPGEDEFRGKGVSYCATCDGPFYKDKNIAVIGGGNAAVEEALYLTRFAKMITIIHRRDKLRADKILAERATNDPKIFIMWNSVVESVQGDKRIEGISVKNTQTGVKSNLPIEGIFIYVGMNPNTGFARGVVEMNADGFIKAGPGMKTSAAGIFACGDVLDKGLRQIVNASGEGAVAADSARKFIEEKHPS